MQELELLEKCIDMEILRLEILMQQSDPVFQFADSNRVLQIKKPLSPVS